MVAARQRYTQEYDRKVRVAITSQPGDWMFSDRPPLAATTNTDATQTALDTFNKLMPENLRHFFVKAVYLHLLVIYDTDVHTVVLSDHAARVPHTEDPAITHNSGIRQQGKA